MRDPALPKSGAQTLESISKYVLCCGNVLYSGLWGYRTGHLAFATLYGHYDLRGSHSLTNTGVYITLYIFITNINKSIDFFYKFSKTYIYYIYNLT